MVLGQVEAVPLIRRVKGEAEHLVVKHPEGIRCRLSGRRVISVAPDNGHHLVDPGDAVRHAFRGLVAAALPSLLASPGSVGARLLLVIPHPG